MGVVENKPEKNSAANFALTSAARKGGFFCIQLSRYALLTHLILFKCLSYRTARRHGLPAAKPICNLKGKCTGKLITPVI